MSINLDRWEFEPTSYHEMRNIRYEQRRCAGLQFVVRNTIDRTRGRLPVTVTIFNDAGELAAEMDAHDIRSLRDWLNEALDEIGEPRNE